MTALKDLVVHNIKLFARVTKHSDALLEQIDLMFFVFFFSLFLSQYFFYIHCYSIGLYAICDNQAIMENIHLCSEVYFTIPLQ